MGRWSKGVCFTTSALRLDIDFLRKNGYIKYHHQLSGIISWTNGNKIQFTSYYLEDEIYFDLEYILTKDGERISCKYRIELKAVPSNLGKGVNLYFICPVSGQLAKKLYSCYNSEKFMHRDEYARRNCIIYYPVQTSSKYEYHNDRYWELERKTIPKLHIKRGKKSYRGKPTKRYLKLQKAYKQMEYFDEERWNPKNLPKSCLPYLQMYDL